jgi:hypothetical protein
MASGDAGMPEQHEDKPKEQPPLSKEEIEQIVASVNKGGPFWKSQYGCMLIVIWVTLVLAILGWAVSQVHFPWAW